jgi:fluoride exporter
LQTWSQIAVLSVGGALGVNARFWLSVLINRWASSQGSPAFPWATVTINITGSFAIGLLAIFLAHHWDHPLGRLFVVTGFLGGYTTFSSFTFESLKLWEDGEKTLSAANTFGSVIGGLAAVVLGVALGRALIGLPSTDEQPVTTPGVERRADGLELPTDTFLEEGRES